MLHWHRHNLLCVYMFPHSAKVGAQWYIITVCASVCARVCVCTLAPNIDRLLKGLPGPVGGLSTFHSTSLPPPPTLAAPGRQAPPPRLLAWSMWPETPPGLLLWKEAGRSQDNAVSLSLLSFCISYFDLLSRVKMKFLLFLGGMSFNPFLSRVIWS